MYSWIPWELVADPLGSAEYTLVSPIVASFLRTHNGRGKSFQLGFNFIIQPFEPELATTWSADFFLHTQTVAGHQVLS
jgi:hypothetical protein